MKIGVNIFKLEYVINRIPHLRKTGRKTKDSRLIVYVVGWPRSDTSLKPSEVASLLSPSAFAAFRRWIPLWDFLFTWYVDIFAEECYYI